MILIVQCITPPQTIPLGGESMKTTMWKKNGQDRRSFIGGSDARTIMGDDEVALVRLWREESGGGVPGGSGRREVHAPAAAQVGGGGEVSGALGDHRRRQVGGDHRPC